MSGEKTIKERLEYLNETKRQMRQALISKGIEFDTNGHKYDDFRSYVQKIKDITVNEAIDVQSIDITENGDYEANSGVAYNPIHVEVKPNTTTKSVSKDGTYRAKDDGADGYSEVSVSVGSSLGTKSITSEDLPDDPGTPKTFKASDEQNSTIGWKEVSVNISGKLGEKVIEVDPSRGFKSLEESEYAREDELTAKDDGLWGWSKLQIKIIESEGPFNVSFYHDTKLLYGPISVPKNGTGVYKGDTPTEEGKRFSGWNPQPINVTQDLKCYAQFEKKSESGSAGGGGGSSITGQTWDQIASTGGRNCEVGDTLRIYSDAFTYNGILYIGLDEVAECIEVNGDVGSVWQMKVHFERDDGEPYEPILANSEPDLTSESQVRSKTYDNSMLATLASSLKTAINSGNDVSLNFASTTIEAYRYSDKKKRNFTDHSYPVDGFWFAQAAYQGYEYYDADEAVIENMGYSSSPGRLYSSIVPFGAFVDSGVVPKGGGAGAPQAWRYMDSYASAKKNGTVWAPLDCTSTDSHGHYIMAYFAIN